MDQNQGMIQVTGRDGLLGWVNPNEQTGEDEILVRLSNGQAILAPSELLLLQEDGTYYLPMSAQQFQQAKAARDTEDREELMVIPVVAEKAVVGKRLEARRVRINKRVREREEMIQAPGYTDQLEVERVTVNQVVDVPPKARKEGDTLIIPLLEEVLVVKKQVLLREEVRVTVRQVPHEPYSVTLRVEDIEVERVDNTPEQAAQQTQEAAPSEVSASSG